MTKIYKQKWIRLGFVVCMMLLTVVGALAQTKTIKGKVVDEKGQPMVGVSIMIKGTKTGTITDINGGYSIAASAKDALSFSFIGYKPTEEKVGARTVVNVSLNEDSQMLQETVITAEFGVKRPERSVGAAIQNVKGSDIAESGRENFIDALQGRVAGVNVTASSGSPGASSTVVFRSPTSISGNNSPLYVIDGIPMSNTTFDMNSQWAKAPATATTGMQNDFTNRGSDIDPDNIESMSVLKGAAAAALYGSDASNGAIIITTKKGRSGQARVSYSNSIKFDQVYRYPELQTQYDQGGYGTTNYYNASKWGARYPSGTTLYDNLANLFQTGISQKHNVSFDAGNDKMTLRASAGFINQTGVVPVAAYNRKNISVSGTAKINNWLNVDASLQYMNSGNTKVAKGSGGVLDLAMRWPLTDNMKNWLAPDGTSIKYPDKYQDIDILNPYYDMYKSKRYDTTDRFISAMNVVITPITDLIFRAQMGWDVSTSTYLTSINPQFTTSTVKSGSYDQSNVVESDPTINILASYRKQFGKFNFFFQAGYHQLEVGSKTIAVHGECAGF